MASLPFDPENLSAADRALYVFMRDRRKAQGAGFGGPYAALMNHPQLCKRVEELGFYLKFEGHVARDVYQFVVLSVARATGAAFEWIDHVEHARSAGLPEAIIEKIRLREEDFPAPYDLVAQLLAATLPWREIPQTLQACCIEEFGTEAYVELVVLSGFYQMFSAINQGFGVPLPAGVEDPFI